MAGQLLGAPRNTISTGLSTTCDGGTCVVPGIVQAHTKATHTEDDKGNYTITEFYMRQ